MDPAEKHDHQSLEECEMCSDQERSWQQMSHLVLYQIGRNTEAVDRMGGRMSEAEIRLAKLSTKLSWVGLGLAGAVALAKML